MVVYIPKDLCIIFQRAISTTPVEPTNDQYAVLDDSESDGMLICISLLSVFVNNILNQKFFLQYQLNMILLWMMITNLSMKGLVKKEEAVLKIGIL